MAKKRLLQTAFFLKAVFVFGRCGRRSNRIVGVFGLHGFGGLPELQINAAAVGPHPASLVFREEKARGFDLARLKDVGADGFGAVGGVCFKVIVGDRDGGQQQRSYWLGWPRGRRDSVSPSEAKPRGRVAWTTV